MKIKSLTIAFILGLVTFLGACSAGEDAAEPEAIEGTETEAVEGTETEAEKEAEKTE